MLGVFYARVPPREASKNFCTNFLSSTMAAAVEQHDGIEQGDTLAAADVNVIVIYVHAWNEVDNIVFKKEFKEEILN